MHLSLSCFFCKQSVTKLLARIVAPDIDTNSSAQLHDHTHGITSDPLTQFAVVLSALIHDVDHPGVPNTQLIQEGVPMASFFKGTSSCVLSYVISYAFSLTPIFFCNSGKSIAEQNSVVLSWHLLMDDQYMDLRRAIYVTETDFIRFRRLVVNVYVTCLSVILSARGDWNLFRFFALSLTLLPLHSVMATDIMDRDLKTLRNDRWHRAFDDQTLAENASVARNRKATIVIEHLIQASDVAHTMQVSVVVVV